ncbi:MAG: hypothetical protein V3V61_06830, partial [Gammaproteobacteria bacterium]
MDNQQQVEPSLSAANAMTLSKDGLTVDPSSYVDPNGFLFHLNGKLYRAIHPHVKSFYQQLFDNGTIKRLVDQLGLVPSAPVRLDLPQLKGQLTIQHEKIKPITFCTEWCPEMLQDAARQTLHLSLELIEQGLMLQDAYPWNIVFDGTKPIFVDFTSIVPEDKRYLWPAYPQYQAFFQRPLSLARMKKDKIARLHLLDNINGISLEDFYQHTSGFYRLSHPGFTLSYHLNQLIQRQHRLKEKMHKIAAQGATVSKAIRRRFFKRLLKQIDRASVSPTDDIWQNYYQDIPQGIDKNKKIQIVENLLQRVNPKTVTDLGCNTGVFSLLAAKQGARVIAIDSSTSCISTLYHTAKHKQLP